MSKGISEQEQRRQELIKIHCQEQNCEGCPAEEECRTSEDLEAEEEYGGEEEAIFYGDA